MFNDSVSLVQHFREKCQTNKCFLPPGFPSFIISRICCFFIHAQRSNIKDFSMIVCREIVHRIKAGIISWFISQSDILQIHLLALDSMFLFTVFVTELMLTWYIHQPGAICIINDVLSVSARELHGNVQQTQLCLDVRLTLHRRCTGANLRQIRVNFIVSILKKKTFV